MQAGPLSGSSPSLPSLLLPPRSLGRAMTLFPESGPGVPIVCGLPILPLGPSLGTQEHILSRTKGILETLYWALHAPMARVIVKGFLGLASVPCLFIQQTFIKYQLGVRPCLRAQPAWLCLTSSAWLCLCSSWRRHLREGALRRTGVCMNPNSSTF